MKTILLTILLAGTSLAQSLKLGSAVLGKVVGDDGSRLPAAWVTMTKAPAAGQTAATPGSTAKPPSPPKSQAARPDGTFGFTGLEPGVYRFCVSFSGTNWLDSCQWGGPAPKVTVGSEQVVDGVVLTMKKGVPLTIRLNDTGTLLSTYEKKTPGAHVLLGVTTGAGGFQPADMVGEDALGQDYRVLIPSGSTVNVVFYSAFFKLLDQKGAAVPTTGTKIPVTTAAGQAPSGLVLTVSGVVKR